MGSGLTIHGTSRFLSVFGIILVSGFTLKPGVSFARELALWFLCGAVLSFYTLIAPPLYSTSEDCM